MLFSLALLSLGGLEEAGFPHLPLHAVSFELYSVCSYGAYSWGFPLRGPARGL